MVGRNESRRCKSPVVKAGEVTAARGQKDAGIAVLLFYGFEFFRQGFQGLIPGDSLELAFPLFPHPL